MPWRRRIVGAVAALVALSVSAIAWSGVIRSDRPDSLYVGLGTQYPSVGQFRGSAGAQGFLASGTLVAPDWVLTAAHVVDRATSLSFSIGGSSYSASSWVASPSWTGDLLSGYDIALVHLSSQVPTSIAPPAVRYTGSSELGQVGTAVGFGMTGTGLSGAVTFDGKKRAEQNVIDQIQNSRLFLSDFDNPRNLLGGSFAPLDLEGLIAPGDSGGGVFIGTGDSARLVGVNSFAGAYDGHVDSDYGDVSGHTRVSAFNSWIDGVIGRSAPTAAAAPMAQPVSVYARAPVPEPSTLVLLATAGLALLLARRFGLSG